MNVELSPRVSSPCILWLDTGGQEDELEDAARAEKEKKKRGEPEEVDEDLERQKRLHPKNKSH